MSVLDTLLSNKPLNEWQQKIAEEGRACPECGSSVFVTAPSSDTEKMVRLSCPGCGWSTYEFEPDRPLILSFEDIKASRGA